MMTTATFDKLNTEGWITEQLSEGFGEITVSLSINTVDDTFLITRYESGMDEVLMETTDVDQAMDFYNATCGEHA